MAYCGPGDRLNVSPRITIRGIEYHVRAAWRWFACAAEGNDEAGSMAALFGWVSVKFRRCPGPHCGYDGTTIYNSSWHMPNMFYLQM